MSFCPTCGRQRVSSTRYCGGCGRDFGVPAMSGSTVPAEELAMEPPHLDLSAEESSPTVGVSPPVPDWPPPPATPEPGRPVYQPPERRPGRKRALWIAVAAIVLLAAGGGAFALVKTTGKPQAAGPGSPSPSLAARATTPPTQPASTQPATPQASAAPSASPSPSPSPSPSVVGAAPDMQPVSPQVEVVLSHYFQGINDRNYTEYASSQTAQGKRNQPESSFDAGYATTTDSNMTLTSLAPTGAGDLTATVTFTSRQSPSDSVDDSACDNWTLNLYLVPGGSGYLIAPAPPDYEPTYTDC
jgi:type IV secretory pathway VirB10-like protein